MRRPQQEGRSNSDIVRVGLGFLGVGLILFSFVWWPIQAERSRVLLSQWENKVSQKQSELDALKTRYASLTSLHVLDQWAAQNGPWRSPSANDVILLKN